MAKLIFIAYTRHAVSYSDNGTATLTPINMVSKMPVIYFINGRLWEEADAYLATRANDVAIGLISIKTLQSIAWCLHSFLNFCEAENIDPMKFGVRRDEKPTYRYRGYLIRQKRGDEAKRVSGTTASTRINTVARFYDWLLEVGQLSQDARPFIPKKVHARFHDTYGFARQITVASTDLSIRRGLQHGTNLEGRLRPVSRTVRDQLIRTAYENSSSEFALMLDLGFRSGMRIQTICGLTIQSVLDAYPGDIPGTHYLRVGPKHGIPTKLAVNYVVQVPTDLLVLVRDYTASTRRTIRATNSQPEDQQLVFLTRWGQPYNRRGQDTSTSISQELHRLRKLLPNLDLREFYFHCTRATFGTSIVMAGLESGERADRVVNRVRQLLGHKHAETSLAYISFVEELKTNRLIDTKMGASYDQIQP